MDQDRVYVGDVDARLHNGGGNQHIDLAVDEIQHDALQLMLFHLPVGKSHPGLRHQLLHMGCHVGDVMYLIIHEIDLSAPCQFPFDGLTDDLVVVFHHVGLDGQPVDGRLF